MRLMLILLAMSATPAMSQDGTFASGWPIALAEAACSGDEGCLTKLANCGPGDAICAAGVSVCELDGLYGTDPTFVCQTDRVGGPAGRVVMIPGLPDGGQITLFFGPSGYGTVNGRPARATTPDCLHDLIQDSTLRARDLATPEAISAWRDAAGN